MLLYYDLTIAYRSQGAECSGLNENCFHKLIYFKMWLPVFKEGSGDVALLYELYNKLYELYELCH